MASIRRYSGTVSARFTEDTQKDEILLGMAEELYKRGIISLTKVYDSETEQDVWKCTASVWWDEDTPEEKPSLVSARKEVEEIEEGKGLGFLKSLLHR